MGEIDLDLDLTWTGSCVRTGEGVLARDTAVSTSFLIRTF